MKASHLMFVGILAGILSLTGLSFATQTETCGDGEGQKPCSEVTINIEAPASILIAQDENGCVAGDCEEAPSDNAESIDAISAPASIILISQEATGSGDHGGREEHGDIKGYGERLTGNSPVITHA